MDDDVDIDNDGGDDGDDGDDGDGSDDDANLLIVRPSLHTYHSSRGFLGPRLLPTWKQRAWYNGVLFCACLAR